MLEQQFAQQVKQYYPTPHRFLIAFSGGLDSTALLILFKKLSENQPHFRLRAIHIHHGLSPNADQWLNHCQQLCAKLNIPIITEKVQVSLTQGIEAGAREARYQALKLHRLANETVVTAHHQQDQTENFLLALKRGSGLQGLGAMQVKSELFTMPIFRPLLTFSRQQLEEYVQQQGLNWIEDESNQDNQYDRNFLRNQILPLLRQRWQYFDHTVQRSAQHCYEQQQLINELLAQEFAQIYNQNEQSLSIEHFRQYSELKQRALLRLWLQQHRLDMPSSIQTEKIINDVIKAGRDRNPQFKLGNKIIRRYQQQLFITPIYQDISHICLTINIGEQIELPDNLGTLTLQKKAGKITALWQTPEQQYLSEFSSQEQQFIIKFHYSGSVKLSPNTPAKDIKKIWQQQQLPVWQRQRIPYLFALQGTELKLKTAVGFWIAI